MDTLEQLQAGLLRGIKRLDMSCGLTEFPREILDLADSLEILNLSGNQLSSLPDDLPRLHKLRIIFCSDNLFTELPAVLGQCKNLTMVGFKANQISRDQRWYAAQRNGCQYRRGFASERRRRVGGNQPSPKWDDGLGHAFDCS